jgi:hypothetical protein
MWQNITFRPFVAPYYFLMYQNIILDSRHSLQLVIIWSKEGH